MKNHVYIVLISLFLSLQKSNDKENLLKCEIETIA